MVLDHLARLGLRVNWEKSKLSPVQSIAFKTGLCYGVKLDYVMMTAHLSQDHAVLVMVPLLVQNIGPSQTLSEAPGAYGDHGTAGTDAYETTSALASFPSSELGMVPRHTQYEHHVVILSALGRTSLFYGQECPWNRCPGASLLQQIHPRRAGVLCAKGMRPPKSGQALDCIGISFAWRC